jgi:hypothetical protein
VIREEDDLPDPVLGLSIVNDVYLGYVFLALTQSWNPVSKEFPLRLRSKHSQVIVDSTQPKTNPSALSLRRIETKSSTRPSTYTSLLEAEPLKLLPPFENSQTVQLTLMKKIPTPSPEMGIDIKKPLETVNINTLRYMGQSVEKFRNEIRDFMVAGNALQARVKLQGDEIARQVSTLAESQSSLKKLLKGGESLKDRIKIVDERQEKILMKVEKLMSRLMDLRIPELGEREKEWTKSMGEMAWKVFGNDGTKEGEDKTGDGLKLKVERVSVHAIIYIYIYIHPCLTLFFFISRCKKNSNLYDHHYLLRQSRLPQLSPLLGSVLTVLVQLLSFLP